MTPPAVIAWTPGIERLRMLLRQGTVDVVVAYAVDRLSRNQNHIGVLFDEVEQAGAKLQFVTEKFEDTAIGRFILAARAFIGEVEREKIAERTMRGKAERARSGKIPQGTGNGCYGYSYDTGAGTRTVASHQATVIRGIFSDFLSGVPIVSITNHLNDAEVPTFSGSKWYPVTVDNVLRNETCTGRTIYRRTSVSMVRDPKTGRKKRQVTKRDPSEWIEIAGATSMIIEPAVFEAAQRILDDPERRRRGRRLHNYFLRKSTTSRGEKANVEEQMHWVSPMDSLPNITDLRRACQRIEDWVLKADGYDFSLLLDALQIEVHAEKGRGELKGLIPEYAPKKSDAHVCSMVINF